MFVEYYEFVARTIKYRCILRNLYNFPPRDLPCFHSNYVATSISFYHLVFVLRLINLLMLIAVSKHPNPHSIYCTDQIENQQIL